MNQSNALITIHILLVLVILFIIAVIFSRYKKLNKLGDTFEVKPRILLLLTLLILISSFIFLIEQKQDVPYLFVAWTFPFLLTTLFTIRFLRRDKISYNTNNQKIILPVSHKKWLFILSISYLFFYIGLTLVNPIGLLSLKYLLAARFFKGIIAGFIIGMNLTYYYKYMKLKSKSN